MAPKRKRSHHSNLKSLSDPIGKEIFIYPRAKKVGGVGVTIIFSKGNSSLRRVGIK
jgi:hypothetical protein